MATTRKLKGGYDLAAKIMAICFSLFYLYTTFFGLISQESHIGIYVLGTFALSFMLYEARKDSPGDRASFIDILIIIGMIIITAYYIKEYPTLADRIGGGTALQDVIFGWVLILVSLEAARRVIGKIVHVIGIVLIFSRFLLAMLTLPQSSAKHSIFYGQHSIDTQNPSSYTPTMK